MEWILFIAVIVAAIWAAKNYNYLWRLAEAIRSRRANILVATKKRAHLAQRLVDIARNYGDHEKLSQLQISEDMTTMAGLVSANQKTDVALQHVASLAMAFPELKANETFQQLMSQIAGIESEVMERREGYNNAVETYNAGRAAFPRVLVAKAFRFEPAPYYDISAEGLDTLAEFTTGDTTHISTLLRRAGDRAQELGKQAGEKMTEGRKRFADQSKADEHDGSTLS